MSAANDEFRAFVADQLEPMDGLVFKRMFSGYGVYREGVIFAIVSGARLYFKVDDESQQTYIDAGMGPFQPNRRQTLRSYYEVPAEVIENRDELARWADRAVEAQLRHQQRDL